MIDVEEDYISQAVVALESGDPGVAASLFETRRRMGLPQASGTRARWLAWHATLTGTALAVLGDTGAARGMADTAQYWGEQSIFGRDRRAHHFLRGLLQAKAGRDSEAVDEYKAAIPAAPTAPRFTAGQSSGPGRRRTHSSRPAVRQHCAS